MLLSRLFAIRMPLLAALLLAALLLGGCASVSTPNRIVLSQAELQGLLNRSFPKEQRLLELFEVRASAPDLRLLADSDRLSVKLDLLARERLLGNQLRGRLDFSAGLRWNASDYSVRLNQVRVQDLAMSSPSGGGTNDPPPARSQRTSNDAFTATADSLSRSALERVGAAVAERVLEDMVLYQLSSERVTQLQALKQQPTLRISGSGLEINFEPAAR